MQPLIDWLVIFASDTIKALVAFVVGMWFFNKYLLPRMAPGMVKGVIETGEVQELIQQAKKTMNELEIRGKSALTEVEKFLEKMRGLNLEEIDGKLINDAIVTIKGLVDKFGQQLDPPEIPEPKDIS